MEIVNFVTKDIFSWALDNVKLLRITVLLKNQDSVLLAKLDISSTLSSNARKKMKIVKHTVMVFALNAKTNSSFILIFASHILQVVWLTVEKIVLYVNQHILW